MRVGGCEYLIAMNGKAILKLWRKCCFSLVWTKCNGFRILCFLTLYEIGNSSRVDFYVYFRENEQLLLLGNALIDATDFSLEKFLICKEYSLKNNLNLLF